MILIELIYNLFALLSLSVISNFIVQNQGYTSKKSQIYQGLLFGLIAVIGMSRPFVLTDGVIFDGHSIVISLSSLLFGPITGLISTTIASLFRLYLGGTGTTTGVLIIFTSFLWGYFYYFRYTKNKSEISNLTILNFGLLVTGSMILLMVTLPYEFFIKFLEKVAPTVFIFYPIITLGIGRILINQILSYDTLISIKDNEESLKTTLYSIGDAVISTDVNGKIIRMNPIAEQLTGWKEKEAKGKGIDEIFIIKNEITGLPSENPALKSINEGTITKITNHTILINKNGKEIPIVDSSAPIKRDEQIIGAVLVFRDQTEERKKLKQLEDKEKFQRFLIANLPGFIYRCAYDKNWTMYYLSDGCYELTGYTPQDFLLDNPTFNDIIHPDYREILYSLWDEKLRKREIFEYEYPIFTKTGEIKWVWERGRGIFSDSGEPLYLEGFITDVSEKKLIGQKLIENEKRLSIITNLISDYLFQTKIEKDGKLKLEWVGGAFEEISGYNFEEYISVGGWKARIHPEDVKIDDYALEKLLNNQQITIELRTLNKKGQIVWVRVFAYPVWDEKEKRVTQIIGAVQNITNEKKSELISQIEVKVSQAILTQKSNIELFEIIRNELALIIDVRNFFVAFYNKESGMLHSIFETDEKDDIIVWKAKGSLTGYLIEQSRTLLLKKSEIEELISTNKIILVGTLPEVWLGVPLIIKDEILGAVVIQDYDNPDAFDSMTIRVMENISRYFSVFIERNLNEQQLIESEERFRNLFENQEAILLLLDAECGMIMDANKSALKFYKCTLDQLKEKTIFDIDTASSEIIKNSIIKIYKGLQNRFEAKHKLFNGEIKDVEIFTSIITIKNHKFIYAIVFDKTEQKKAEKEIHLLKTAVVQNPSMIIITNTEGEIEFVNPKFSEVTGYPSEEILGKNTRILKSGFHADEYYSEMWKTIKSGSEWHDEFLNKKKDGSLYWVETIISPIKELDGKITHFVAVQEDITQRKKVLEQLVKSEEEFRSVWENSVDAMRLVNEDGIVVNVNQAYCNLFKVERELLIGKIFNAAYVIRDEDKSLSNFIQRFKLRTIRKKFETEIQLHNGEMIWVELTNAFIEIKNSAPLLLSIFRDITAYKKLLNETIQAKEKAEEMNRVKSYFFANMSHELRTPLVGILGFADILIEELEDRPDLRNMAELISKSGNRLKETLNLILSLSKLESGKLEVKLKEENIIPYIKNSFELYEQTALKKGLNYNLIIPENEVICRIDNNLFQNVLNNLISNAIKFTEKGSVDVKIELIKTKVRIHVIDTGIGIAKEYHNLIWDEFRQVSEGLNRSFEGTGLGLTIVKRFTNLMGGRVFLESELGKGSDFILEFDFINPIKNDENNSFESQITASIPIEDKINKFDLLYVEDDQASIDIVSLMLKNKYTFDIARNSEEALIKVKQNSYRAILMDINLQRGQNGLEIASMIRNLSGYENIPIAAVTAYALSKDKESFLSQGMTHYLAKPFSKTDLYNLINDMLKK